jgi:transposase-like protein
VQFEITEPTRDAVGAWIGHVGLTTESALFSAHLSTRQYVQIVSSWVEQLGLDRADYGTHALRRTKAPLIYRRTKNLRAVQLLLGQDPDNPFPGKGTMKPEEAEIFRLKRELMKVTAERDILKKALAYFAKEPQ